MSNASQVKNVEDTFKDMVKRHDLTFNFSDDSSVWRRGQDSLDAIKEMAKQLPRHKAVAIWNAECDRKLTAGPNGASLFYWKE